MTSIFFLLFFPTSIPPRIFPESVPVLLAESVRQIAPYRTLPGILFSDPFPALPDRPYRHQYDCFPGLFLVFYVVLLFKSPTVPILRRSH